jgi:hypothetical protein
VRKTRTLGKPAADYKAADLHGLPGATGGPPGYVPARRIWGAGENGKDSGPPAGKRKDGITSLGPYPAREEHLLSACGTPGERKNETTGRNKLPSAFVEWLAKVTGIVTQTDCNGTDGWMRCSPF